MNQKIKPYISRIEGVWEVLNCDSDVSLATSDWEEARRFFEANFDLLLKGEI